MIAWEMVLEENATPAEWLALKRAARLELVPHNMWVTGVNGEDVHRGKHRLTKLKVGHAHSKRGKRMRYHGGGTNAYHVGDFKSCCLAAIARIEPHNYPTR